MSHLYFASDNGSGIHADILAAIERANRGYCTAYGDDEYSERAVSALRSEFGADAEIFFTFNGTGANVVGLAAIARSFEAVICAEHSHIWSDECAAPEKFFGGKLIPIASSDGKLSPHAVAASMGENRGVHHAVPKVISITQASEWGTVYSRDEIADLARYAHDNDMLLHVDGARLANAAAHLGCTLGELTAELGVDVLSFGGTKNGLMLGEAVIFMRPELAENAGYLRKQTTQLASKMRFVAAQFEALMGNDLWRKNATHANAMAARLAAGVGAVQGIELCYPPAINALFVKIDPRFIAPLHEQSMFYMWDEGASIARWMTSFNTSATDVDEFIELIKQVSAKFATTRASA